MLIKKLLTISLALCMAVLIPGNGFAAVQNVGVDANIDANGIVDGCNFTADAILTVTDTDPVNSGGVNADAITNSVGAANNGTVTFAGDSIVTGDIGQAANGAIKQINMSQTKNNETVTVNKGVGTGNVSAQGMTFTANKSGNAFTLGDGVNLTISNNITTANDTRGQLAFSGSSTVAVTGDIGAVGSGLDCLIVNGASSTVSITADNIYLTGNVDVNGVGSTTSITADTISLSDLDFNVDATVSLGDGTDLTGNIATNAGDGTLILNGTSSVTGQIGDKQLKEVRGGSIGGIATFTGDVKSNALDVNGTGEIQIDGASTITLATLSAAGTLDLNGTLTGAVDFGADGIVELADNANVTGAIDNTTGVDGAGTLTIEGASTIGGNVGAVGANLKQINANGAGTTVLLQGSAFATALNFGADGTVALADNVNLTAAITTSTSGTGALTFNGTSTVGDIGAAGNTLKQVNIDGGLAETVTITGDIHAVTVNYGGRATATIADGKNLNTTVTTSGNNNGVLTFFGTSTVNNQTGAAGLALDTINANGAGGKTVTFNQDVYAGTLNFGDDGEVIWADNADFSNDITTSTAGTGTLTFQGTSTVGGNVGGNFGPGNSLKSVTGGAAGEKVTFSGTFKSDALTLNGTGEIEIAGTSAITLATLTGAGTLDLNGTLTGAIDFGADGTVELADNVDVSGAINNTTGADGAGTLTVEGTSTIGGNVGATNRLKSITGGAAGDIVTFSGTVGTNALTVNGTGEIQIEGASTITLATLTGAGTLDLNGTLTGAIDFGADGTVELADNVDVSGAINNTTGADGAGTLTVEGTSTIGGNVGATNRLKSITGGAAGDIVTFSGTVGTNALTVNGTGEIQIEGASTITLATLTGAGTLDLNGTLTGAIDFGADGTVELADNVDVSGAINNTTGADGAGTLTVGGTSTISGNVGATNRLKSITGGAAGEQVTFSGTVGSNALDVNGTGEIQIEGASTITLATLTGAGTLDLNGTLTGAIDFGADGTVELADNVDVSGAINNTTGADGAGTLTVEGTSTIGGNVGATNRLKSITGGAAGEQVTFSGTVGSNALDVNGTGEIQIDGASTITLATLSAAGTLDLNGTLTGAIDFGADGIVELADNVDVSGAINNTTGADGAGTLTVEGTSTIGGNVGATNSLKLVNAGAVGETVTFSGTVAATDTKVTGTGTVNLNGNTTSNIDFDGNGTLNVGAGRNVTGTILNSTGGFGTVNYLGSSTTGGNLGVAGTGDLAAVNIRGGGTLTLDHNIAAITTTVDSAGDGGSLTLTGDRTITGDLTLANSGVLTIGLNTLTLAGTGIYTQGPGMTLNASITNNSTFGSIVASGNAAVTGGALSVTVGSEYIAGDTTFNIINGAAGGAITVPTITDNSYVIDFTGAAVSGDLVLTTVRTNAYFTVSGDANTIAAGEALEQAGKLGAAGKEHGANGDMLTVLGILDSMSSAKEIERSIETMHPDASAGTMHASRAIADMFFSGVSNRLGFARNGVSGIATGDMLQGVGFWLQGLGSHLKQDERKGIKGYQANTFGTMIGVDKLIDTHFRMGLAGGFGFADVNSKAAGSPTSTITSWQGVLYASFDSLNLFKAREVKKNSRAAVRSQGENNWYVDGMFGFTQNNYDSRRVIWLPGASRIAKAEHHGQEYSGQIETGYTFVFQKTKALEVTPFATLGYSFLYMNQYDEKGADSLNLSVDGEGFHQLVQGLGTKLAYPIESKKAGTFIPSVKAAWLYDYVGDRFETTSTFAGGGPSFDTKGAKPARNGMLVGAELAFLNKDNLTVTGNWDMELKENYQGQTYYGSVRLDF